jgi:hypothetical protein
MVDMPPSGTRERNATGELNRRLASNPRPQSVVQAALIHPEPDTRPLV